MRALIPRMASIPFLLSLPSPAFAQQCPAIQPVHAAPVPPAVIRSIGAVETRAIADPACQPDLPLHPFAPDAIAAIPALKALSQDGRTLLDLGICHGMRGVFARKGAHFQTYYITPDGERPIGGVMWTLDGENITRSQIHSIAGTIPVVRVGAPASGASETNAGPATRLSHAWGGSIGRVGAPHLWMVIDPLCGYSQRAWLTLKPLVDNGRLRLTLIPIAVNDHENNEQSTPAAEALLTAGADALPPLWLRILDTAASSGGAGGSDTGRFLTGLPHDEYASLKLIENRNTALEIGLQGTPTFAWRDTAGVEHKVDGIPADLLDVAGRAAP